MATETKSHGDYSVGWICALPKEQTAATAMLDKRHANLPKPSNDSNTYTLGSIGPHNVVIACLPKGQYGTNSAATVATLMVRTFPSIKIGLLVGIGGGIPPKARLGDVVVSTPIGQYPGVVQWDLGKAKEGGEFERTGVLNNPPSSLLSALAHLETERELNGSKIPDFLKEFEQKYPRAAKRYLRPDSLQDVLFKADYAHVNEHSMGNETLMEDDVENDQEDEEEGEEESDDEEEGETCRLCSKTMIVKRKRRSMRVHYGLIASGNQVIKDGMFRDKLNKGLGGSVLCVEMEAAGLMNNFPCLVIRGICDYSDSHKNKAWQEHAAAVAAAFAKELLGCVQSSDIEGERLMSDVLNEVKHDIQLVHKKVEDGFVETKKDLSNLIDDKEVQKQKEALNWLSHIDFAPYQHDYITRCEPGTGQSLLNSGEVQNWLATSQQTLFCPGVPGAGKTFQTSILINHLVNKFEDNTTIGIAFIYYNFNRQRDQKAEHVLANLIKQLARNQKPHLEKVQALHNQHRQKETRPLLGELSQFLTCLIKSFSRVFILIDALDECEDNDYGRTKLLDQLFFIQKETGLNLFSTSRFISGIVKRFEGCVSREIHPSRHDIFRFLDARMSQLPTFVANDTNLQEEIKTSIVSAIEGMFLLAQLYVDSLVGKRSPAALRESLKALRETSAASDRSATLDEAYYKAMERIQRQKGDLPSDALLILAWIVKAKREIKVPELQEALTVEIGRPALDKDNTPTIEHITQACAPLVVVDGDTNIVRLVHYTTQEYFERPQNMWMREAHIKITNICMTYLSFSAFHNVPPPRHYELEEYFLHDYAVENWGYHAHDALAQGLEPLKVVEFLERVKQDSWYQTLIRRHLVVALEAHGIPFPQMRFFEPKDLTALHIAACFGLYDVVVKLLAKGYDPNAEDSVCRTPLLWAAKNGHAQVVELLLELNVNLEAKDDVDHQTPLSMAARRGHVPIVRLLLDKGANLESRGGFDSPRMPEQELRELQESTDMYTLKIKKDLGLTPLAWAAKNGHKAVVELLLTKNANLEAKDDDGMTPLAYAASEHEMILELFLAKNPNIVETKDHYGMTPLAWAAKNGYEAGVKLLLARNANLEAKAKYGVTPLGWAAAAGQEAMIKLLLANNADLEANNNDGMTPLALAILCNRPAAAELLIASKANVSCRDAGGSTVLHIAAMKGSLEIFKLLLKSNAVGVNVMDKNGRTPLSYAAQSGNGDAVRALLASGKADIESTDIFGRTPMWYAKELGNESVVQIFRGFQHWNSWC